MTELRIPTVQLHPRPKTNLSAAQSFFVLLTFPTPYGQKKFLQVSLPPDIPTDAKYALEPRTDLPRLACPQPFNFGLLPESCPVSQAEPVSPNASELSPVFVPPSPSNGENNSTVKPIMPRTSSPPPSLYSSQDSINPGNLLSTAVSAGFHSLLRDFDSVFNPNFPGYNGAVYSFQAKVNMGPVEPPQRKWSFASTCS